MFTTGTTSISGTTDANASLYLYVDGVILQTATASAAGAFTFSNLAFSAGQRVYIVAELNTGTVKTSKCAAQTAAQTITCYTTPPTITADNNNQITAGSPITGTSGEPEGAIIKVYTSANALVATTTVQADGTWSTGNAGTTPATYNAVAATTYYATAQNGTCGISVNSANATAAAPTSSGRCGSISGPVAAGATSVLGSLTGSLTSTVVNLYMDGINIGTTTTATNSWTINVAATALYPNGVLTVGIQEPGKQEVICSSSVVVNCSVLPTAPVVNPNSFNILPNQSVTYTITNAVSGYFYGIADATTGQSLADGVWATSNGNLTITTKPFNSSGSYNVVVKATNLSGVTVCTSIPTSSNVAVNSAPLPVTFLNLSAAKSSSGLLLTWTVANEQNVSHYEAEKSTDGRNFSLLAKLAYKPVTAFVNTYTLPDNTVMKKQVYYRIKQVDRDGHYHYSSIIQVNSEVNSRTQVAPNPATDNLVINISSEAKEKATIQLLDMNGRIVYETSTVLMTGNNAIGISGLLRFARGQYVLKLARTTSAEYFKIVLQ